jgi:uncharacterized protein YkwD
MKTTLAKVALPLLLGLPSCASDQAAHRSAVSPSPGSTKLSNAIHEKVNAYRNNCGAHGLTRHAGLDRLAQGHSQYMLQKRGTFGLHGKNVSHMGSESRSAAAAHLYGMRSCSENVASITMSGSETNVAENLMRLWKSSPAHEAAIRAREYTHTGIGVAVDKDGTVFATQLFGAGGNSMRSSHQRFTGF